MTDESNRPFDPILTVMESKHAFHLQEAARIGRDIAEYRRMRSEYPDPYQVRSPVTPTQAAAPYAPAPTSRPAPLPQADLPSAPIFDGTFGGLIASYRTHE